ncbi:ATP-Hypothetical protein cassette sub-family A ABC1 member [Nesidiocoris tenuis]|uniref:ABC transporter domain-containing protein n=1 Tax=Nesidiocoris tenuis TaxID=355587 RepID=A0ABN7APJ4_9HEMI|nr:ATP-Hypothetical protein cassette sub-family A ABC1 member [Nesidiocoris tenuis]
MAMNGEEKSAVIVSNAWKRYTPKVVILKGLNMNVADGSIYGLLGPSGCGKTSLLSCIVGFRTLDSGTIQVGARQKIEIGFMPQDISLNKEFTVSEVFHFYGSIYGLSEERIKQRGAELVKFLEIPHDDRFIGDCSGGQQRRISMAVTLLHDPKILILDEPTVGVDPVLCANIWEHFVDLVRNRNKTIIITTHYIEEAKNANRIGLMRGGVLLAEKPPQALLRQFNVDSLEAAFLKLSAKQETDEPETDKQFFPPRNPNIPPLQNETMFEFHRFKAQFIKNVNWTKRNVSITAFVIYLPAVLFFILGYMNNTRIGDYPVSPRPIALVNDEVDSCHNMSNIRQISKGCKPTMPISCRYAESLTEVFSTVDYDEVDEAKQAVRKSKAYGVLHFEANFSANMMKRMREQTSASKAALEGSDVKAYLDMSEYCFTVRTLRELGERMIDLLQDIIEECGFERKIAAVPLHIEEEMYTVDDIMQSFVPPYFGSVAFYTTAMYTSSSIVMERSSGLFERSKIAGLTMFEIIVAHVVIQIIVMFIQNALSFVVLFGILGNPMRGNMGTAWLIMSLNELAGMGFGFFLSVLITAEKNVAYVGIATVLSLFMLTGTLWPVQGIHWSLKTASSLIPVKYSGQAFLDVTIKGYGFTRYTVLIGMLVPILTMIVLALLSYLAIRLGLGSMD